MHEAWRVAEADKVEDGAVLVVGHAGRLVRPRRPRQARRSNQQRKHRRKRFPLHFPLSILFFFHVQLGKTNTHHHISSSGDGNGEGERDDDKSPHDGGTTDVPSGGVTLRTADASEERRGGPSFLPSFISCHFHFSALRALMPSFLLLLPLLSPCALSRGKLA